MPRPQEALALPAADPTASHPSAVLVVQPRAGQAAEAELGSGRTSRVLWL